MSARTTYDEVTIPIEIDITEYLTSLSIDPADITEIAFTIKADKTAVDTEGPDIYYRELGSDLTHDGLGVVTAVISDFSNLEVDKKYHVGLGVKLVSDTKFREVRLASDSKTIYFDQDILRG